MNKDSSERRGPVKTTPAVQHSRSQNTTSQAQIDSMRRLYQPRKQLTEARIHDSLRRAGFDHVDRVKPSGDGRFPAFGKGPTNTDAAYNVTADGQALHWFDFPTCEKGTVFADDSVAITPAESARRFEQSRLAKLAAESEKRDSQHKAAELARGILHVAIDSGCHPYINNKQLASMHNARIEPSINALLIPMWVSGVGLVNLQRIFPDGTKRFLKNGRVKGAYSVIGSLNGAEKVLVCEGWATGATLHEKTGRPVVIAFNAGNLSSVCQSLRSRFSNIEVVVCGDDDRNGKTNTGRIKAIEAAAQIGAKVTFPDLCKDCNGTDFNDQSRCTARGAGAV